MLWHRSEPRQIRPFFGTQEAETALDQTSIRLTPKGEASVSTSFQLDDLELEKFEPLIYPAVSNPIAWLPEGMETSDFEFVMLVRQSFLKRSELILRAPLSEPLPSEIPITRPQLKKFGGGRDTEITVAIALASDREPKPGTPFIGGHWVAKKSFQIRTRTSPVLFDIRPRTEEEWVANGYPAQTLYASEYLSGIEGSGEEGNNSVAVVYIHSDAHDRLVDSKLGDALQPMLAAEIIASILTQSLPDWESLETAPEGSPLEKLVGQLSEDKSLKLSELAAMVKTKPSHARALVQSRLGVVQSLK